MIKMISKDRNKEIDETKKKLVNTRSNKNNGNSNMAYTHFKFVSILSMIDY